MKISNQTAAEKIRKIPDGKIFSVTFIKRTDGTVRDMVCRKGVSLGVKGTGERYDPDVLNLVCVYDMMHAKELTNALGRTPTESERVEIAAKSYRSINLESIMSLKVDGEEFVVNEYPIVLYKIDWVEGGVKHTHTVHARVEKEACVTFRRETGKSRMPNGYTITRIEVTND